MFIQIAAVSLPVSRQKGYGYISSLSYPTAGQIWTFPLPYLSVVDESFQHQMIPPCLPKEKIQGYF